MIKFIDTIARPCKEFELVPGPFIPEGNYAVIKVDFLSAEICAQVSEYSGETVPEVKVKNAIAAERCSAPQFHT